MATYFRLLTAIVAQLTMMSLLGSSQNPMRGNVTDLLALLDFRSRIIDDPSGIMTSWNDSSHYCTWTGITCDNSSRRVTVIDLISRNLVGSLPPSIGNLSFLTGIDLRYNGFRGQLPQEVGLLAKLENLNLTSNLFDGMIPSDVSHCKSLTFLALELNQFSGQIPDTLSSLSNLRYLGLGGNNLTGRIPSWIGNFSSDFWGLSLAINSLHGGIPQEIGHLSGLHVFQVYGNQLSGEIPSSLYNLTIMRYFSVALNQLHGEIPADIGLRFPNLEVFAGGVNNFTGRIPVSLSNASRLSVLDFANNSLTGTVPSVLGSLPGLYRINFDSNLLGNGEADDLNFLDSLTNCTNLQVLGLGYNFFGGQLPISVSNLSTKLTILTLGGNQMHGNIPVGIGNLVNLSVLGLESNYYTGNIPYDIGKLQNLGNLNLNSNQLSGMIPVSLGNLTALNTLFLESNMLQGSIPSELGNCRNLRQMNLSSNNLSGTIPRQLMSLSSLTVFLGMAQNSLSGPLPVEVGGLVNLHELDVSDNQLSGQIPSSLGSCTSLVILLMGCNQFQGPIPESLEALKGLEEMDFSRNNLTGTIPEVLGKLHALQNLNLSFNDLEGEVSNAGILSNESIVSVEGNNKLCGGAASLRLPACSKPVKKTVNLRIIIPVVSVAVFLVLVCFLSLWYIAKKPKKQLVTASSPESFRNGPSYQELYNSTNGFSPENLIGSGSFGSVYKGILGDNPSPVAIKVLNLNQRGAIRSFMDECATLKSIKHRNLLKIITACSTIDFQGNEFKCLIFEFMTNGSLDEWLHPTEAARNSYKNLNIMVRLNIAIDVASAIDYLHNYSHSPIIHCDLKPSNILLDEDLTAHVGDFGLAKFLLDAPLKQNKYAAAAAAASVELKGSIGYIPPEYGTRFQISHLGDVYSFGILVLELFTGKRPTDEIFIDGLNLHKYVAMSLPDRYREILDPSMVLAEEKDGKSLDRLISVSVMKVGVSCSMPLPKDRMSISIAVNQLQSIRGQMSDNHLHIAS